MALYLKRAIAFFIVQGLTLLSIVPWVILSYVLLFAFDAPGSEENWIIWVFVLPVWIYPAPMFICLGGSWIFFVMKKYTGALALSVFPLLCVFVYFASAGTFLYFRELIR